MDDGKIIVDGRPRGAWDDIEPWTATGVGIPDVVRLARALPDAFPHGGPLSVEEAVTALRGGWFESALASSLADRRASRGSAGGAGPEDDRLGGEPGPPVTESPSAPNASQPVLSWRDLTVAFAGCKAVAGVSPDVCAAACLPLPPPPHPPTPLPARP